MTTIDAVAGKTLPAPAMDERDIYAEQVRQLYRLSRIGYGGSLVNAVIITIALWDQIPLSLLGLWFALVLLVTGGRFALYRAFTRAQPAAAGIEIWCRRFIWGATAVGCLWGLLGSVLLPGDTSRQFLVVFLIGGMVAAALVVLTPVKRAFLAFMLPALLPLAGGAFIAGTPLHLTMGLLIVVYIAVMLATHLSMHQIHVETLRTRRENADLVRQLSTANRETAEVNTELTARVAEQKRIEEALRQSSSRLKALIDFSPLAIVALDAEGVVERWNRTAERFFGWTEQEVLGRTAPHVPRDEEKAAADMQAAVLRGIELHNVEAVRRRKDGTRVHVVTSTAGVRDDSGRIAGVLLLIDDVTQRVRAERMRDLEHAVTRILAEARSSNVAVEAVLRAACEATGSVYGGRWVCDPDDGMLRCAETHAEDTAGLREFVAVTRSLRRRPGEEGGLLRQVWETRRPLWIEDLAHAGSLIRGEAARDARLASAFAFPIMTGGEFYGAMEFFARERIARDDGLLSIMRDIASQVGQFLARKEAESHLRFFANHDALTGLPNRAMFNQRLGQAVAQAGRHGKRVAVLFIDLDRFKIVNDTLGHETGDLLLRDLAARLRDSLRAGDTLGRQGGDEFVILLEDIPDPKDISDVSQKILDTVCRPLLLQGQEYAVTASIGVSVYPDDGRGAQDLLKNADIAMYRAKEQGRNAYQFYSASMNAHSLERLALEAKLRRALERQEFLLHYQPKVDLASGRLVGVEALIRWRPAEGVMVPPGEFIPLAEETGMIGPIGEWVLRAACADARRWRAAGHAPLRMAVNLSARQFVRETLTADISDVLSRCGLPPSTLELEITESVVMQDPERAARVLADLNALGVHVAIDDFGTGYSSLGYLKRFPVDLVKIDRTFIEGIPGDDDDVVITRAVIAMAHSLGLRVTAEGVETREQLAFLKDQGCDEVQGFLVGKPVAAAEIEAVIARGGVLPASV